MVQANLAARGMMPKIDTEVKFIMPNNFTLKFFYLLSPAIKLLVNTALSKLRICLPRVDTDEKLFLKMINGIIKK